VPAKVLVPLPAGHQRQAPSSSPPSPSFPYLPSISYYDDSFCKILTAAPTLKTTYHAQESCRQNNAQESSLFSRWPHRHTRVTCPRRRLQAAIALVALRLHHAPARAHAGGVVLRVAIAWHQVASGRTALQADVTDILESAENGDGASLLCHVIVDDDAVNKRSK
jgi:hypothetical protein